MTRKEAINIISHYDVNFYWISGEHEGEKIPPNDLMDAFDMAIKALKQEPCEDAISRKEAINIARIATASIDEVVNMIKKLPSVTPIRPKGKWIKEQSGDYDFPEAIVCSRCHNENSHLDFNEHNEPIGKVFVTSKFCPNCGADMQEDNNTE